MTNKQLNSNLNDSKPGALDLVCFSHLRWDFVYQRPQHLLGRSARERRVFFVYPNENAYTRVTEFKYLTGQKHAKTTLVYEYPTMDGDPYYPIPRTENAQLYARYQALAAEKRGVYFAGRLATYKYYNMDQVVAQAITLYSRIQGLERSQGATQHTLHYVPVNVQGTESQS